jgi:vacuolar-type H+-ATPase subunit H
MTKQKTWGEVGRELLQKLEGITDESAIKAFGNATIQNILNQEPTPKGRANALRMVSREINKTYPRLKSKASGYWYDPRGKESEPKWRHLIFKSLTLSTPDWDAVGDEARDEARQEWKSAQPELQQTEPPQTSHLTVTIQQLDLDDETQQTLKEALSQSGMEIADFVKQAVKVYAKTITGKSKKHSEDLSAVSTGELLTDSKYSTHPGRATELTKRTIQAIRIYNTEVATEPSDRWMITASAIASLIGSRQSTIKEIMPQYQTSIDENNLNPEWKLTPYSNRKPGKKIDEIIQLAELVPDGIS